MRTYLFSIVLLGTLACHGTPNPNGVDDSGAPVDGGEVEIQASKPPAAPRDRSITIERGQVHEFHEVELDPRAEAALTLDPQGGLRLWPTIRSTDPEQLLPYVLPMEEPMWISLAQAQGGFVVATIDTNNTGQVVAISQSADGKTAKLTPLFATPPSDPLLEIHALDGGERVLALGLDHRVRLYDRSGKLLSVLDQRSFAPWQLRVVHTDPTQPKIAAVLAQPPRVQSLALRDDVLSIEGEARTVVLDRGPNHNDLTLSPDGKTVAALRRRSGRGRDFSIELIDLQTGERKLIAGQSDTTIRPRVHFVEAARILLETGSSKGTGLWLELDKAEALADPADASPDSNLAKRLYKTKHDSIPLAASAEHKPQFFDAEFDPPWDHGERLHASVVAGLRVNIERDTATRLIIDPLDSDRHVAISGGVTGLYRASALDRTGAHVVTSAEKLLRVTRVGDSEGALAEIEHGFGTVMLLAFADDRHLLLVNEKAQLRLFDWQAGQVVASSKLDAAWTFAAIGFDMESSVLAWRGNKPKEPVRLLTIANGQLGSVAALDREQRSTWLELLDLGEANSLLGRTEQSGSKRIDEYASDRTGRLYFTERHPRTPLFVVDGETPRSIALPAGQARELTISPDGSKLAIVQFRERDDSFRQDHLLSVIDTKSGERLWTIGAPTSIPAPSWSGDGSRLITSRATIRDAATGEVIGTADRPLLIVQDRSDAEWAKQTGFDGH